MPVFNEERHVRAAIESVQRQTFEAFELIVIDDASTDRTAEIVRSLAADDDRVRYLRAPTNQGVAAALNRGLDAVRAPLIARMDGDDLCRPERLARQHEALSADPALDVCGSAIRCFDERGEWTVIELVAEDAAIKFGTLLRWPISPTLAHGALMFRARFFAGRRYDTSKRYCEDAALYLDAALAGPVRFANLPDVLYDYRVHSGSVSVAHQETQREEHIEMLCRTMLAEGALEAGDLDDYRAILRYRPCSSDEGGRARVDRIFERLESFAVRRFQGCSARVIAEHATRVRARWWERVRDA
jgi:hypothetical protein